MLCEGVFRIRWVLAACFRSRWVRREAVFQMRLGRLGVVCWIRRVLHDAVFRIRWVLPSCLRIRCVLLDAAFRTPLVLLDAVF